MILNVKNFLKKVNRPAARAERMYRSQRRRADAEQRRANDAERQVEHAERRYRSQRRRANAEQRRANDAERKYRSQRRRANAEQRRANGAERQVEHAERKYRSQRRRADDLTSTLKAFERLGYRYGSLTPGVNAWQKKWDASAGKRILLLAKTDYSGSFYKWAQAINENTDFAARLVCTQGHSFGYPLDLVLPNPNHFKSKWRDLWLEADVLHLKDEVGFMNGSNMLPAEMLDGFEGPRIHTQYGGYARKHSEDPAYISFLRSFDEVVSMTPDLCFEWLGSSPIFIPHSVDTRSFQYQWTDSNVVAHSPSTAGRKGTSNFIRAFEQLSESLGLRLDLIQGVSHEACIERKRHAGLFFDQAGREMIDSLGIDTVIGWYGNSALEAAVHGIPTAAHLSEFSLRRAEESGLLDRNEIPFLNIGLEIAKMSDCLREYFSLSSKEKKEISLATRKYVEQFHSHEAVAQQLEKTYSRLT